MTCLLTVRLLLDAAPGVVGGAPKAQPKNRQTLLIGAAAAGCEDIIELLLGKGVCKPRDEG